MTGRVAARRGRDAPRRTPHAPCRCPSRRRDAGWTVTGRTAAAWADPSSLGPEHATISATSRRSNHTCRQPEGPRRAVEAGSSSRSRITFFVVPALPGGRIFVILCLRVRTLSLSLVVVSRDISNTKDVSGIHKRFSECTKKVRMVSHSGLPKLMCNTPEKLDN